MSINSSVKSQNDIINNNTSDLQKMIKEVTENFNLLNTLKESINKLFVDGKNLNTIVEKFKT